MSISKEDFDRRIRRFRLLKPTNYSPDFAKKAQLMLNIYKLATKNKKSSIRPYIFEGFQADIRQLPELKTIMLDCHFADVAWLIAASFYSQNTKEFLRQLTYLLISDNLLCTGNIVLSHKYSKLFRSNWLNDYINKSQYSVPIELVYHSQNVQILLAIEHELSHFRCEENDFLTSSIKQTLHTVIDDHNAESRYINAIDISKIKPFLDLVDKSACSSDNQFRIIKYSVDLKNIIMNHIDLVTFPDGNKDPELLLCACDNYVRGINCSVLDTDTLATECTCDLLALAKHLRLEIDGFSSQESRQLVTDAYILVLLLEDIVELSKEACKLGKNKNYRPVDYIYMRRMFVRQILPSVLTSSCGYKKKDLEFIIKCFDNASSFFDYMYAIICESVTSADYSLYRNEIILLGSEEWDDYMMEIIKNLMIPFDQGFSNQDRLKYLHLPILRKIQRLLSNKGDQQLVTNKSTKEQ